MGLVSAFGAWCFGVVVGWITYRTLVRKEGGANISDIAAVVAAVGGGVITNLFVAGTLLFGWYSIGLTVGFFGYLISRQVWPEKVRPTESDDATTSWRKQYRDAQVQRGKAEEAQEQRGAKPEQQSGEAGHQSGRESRQSRASRARNRDI